MGMIIFLYVMSGLVLISALFTSLTASSAIHQVIAGLEYLTAAVLFCTAAVLSRLDQVKSSRDNRSTTSDPEC